MIRIRATDDGTYTVYRDDAILLTGLTRDQADDGLQCFRAPSIANPKACADLRASHARPNPPLTISSLTLLLVKKKPGSGSYRSEGCLGGTRDDLAKAGR
jgi:hypothetical protein